MNDIKQNILIVGNGAAASALAKKLFQYENTGKIFITGADDFQEEFYEYIDIREDDLTSLLKFVVENNIDLTIPISNKSLKTDIVSFFQSNGQNIFGPCQKASRNFINKINCKKFLYKNKAPVAKFSMQSKYSQAIDYLENATFPLIISNIEPTEAQDSYMLCTTSYQAEKFIEKLFLNSETDILIQEYPYGTNFTAYYFTDGYSAIYLTSVRNFKFQNSDKSGNYTNGTGCYVPEYKLNECILNGLQIIINNILNNLNHIEASYTGIIGIECVLTDENNFIVQDLKPFIQNHDASAVLSLCEDNLLNIMNACINGSFSDEYNEIKTNNYSSVSVCIDIDKGVPLKTLDKTDIDYNNIYTKNSEIYSNGNAAVVLTKSAPTLSSAKNKIYEYIEGIPIKKIKLRKDICDNINL